MEREPITQLVSAQVLASPGALALSGSDETLTYLELETQANQIAHLLPKEAPIGLLMSRCPKAVVGALAILKAGAPYLPLDPGFPADRLASMLSEAGVQVVVTASNSARRLPSGTWKTVLVDDVYRLPESAPAIRIQQSDLAYIIYTSGSTGRPKGVMITHANLSNLVSWHQQAFQITARDRASQVANLGFDAAVWEIWPYLAVGASVHFADEESRREPELLRDWLIKKRITIGFAPTPAAEHLITMTWPADSSLRILLTGADTLRRYPRQGLPFSLVNNYGPTECTVVSTSGLVPVADGAQQPPSIGVPISNVRAYILDEKQHPVKPGEPGELAIGGAGVARGYLNRPEATAESFIDDVFGDVGGAKLYRTGDLAQQREDGQIAFLGRLDNQIKIRGYRIEPEEITTVLMRHPGVRSAFVSTWQDSMGEKRVAAYLVSDGPVQPADIHLKDFLRTRLPEYMIPADFVWLERYPLTANGKVDRAALPAPIGTSTPANQSGIVEVQISEMLAHLLGVKQVARDDNFFLLGGHSLLGAQLVARIREVFGVSLSLRNLFEAPTVSALAAAIQAKQPGRMADLAK